MNNLGFTREELIAAGLKEELEIDQPVELGPDVCESSFEATQVQLNAKESLDFLAALLMPTVFKYFYPAVFQSVWKWLTAFVHKTRDFSQLALGLPRGFGKTTLVKIFIAYCIFFTRKKFILVISSTASLAENILSDVVDMLNEPNVKAVFGDWRLGLEKDTQALKKFGFRGRNIILAGIGAGTSLRGMNLKNERPDVMIFEDVQTRECADSGVQSDALERWIIGTAMKAKSPMGCLYLFVANMYPTKFSILRKLKSNSKWIKFIAGGILSNGESLWEELQPKAQLMDEFQNDLEAGHPEIFYAEVLNDDTASSNHLIDLSKLPAYPFDDNEIPVGNFIIIDPSNDKANSDAVSVGYFEVMNGYAVAREIKEGSFSPGDTIKHAIELCLRHNCRLVAIESNAYQYSLLYWSNFICLQLGISGIEFVEIYSGSTSKNSRILEMFKSLLAGEQYIHPDVYAQVAIQITQFNPLKRDNTDGILDLLTYVPKVLNNFGEFIVSLNIITAQDYDNIKVLDSSQTSSF